MRCVKRHLIAGTGLGYSGELITCISSRLWVRWRHNVSLKWTRTGVFTPWTVANVATQDCPCSPCREGVKHWQTRHCLLTSALRSTRLLHLHSQAPGGSHITRRMWFLPFVAVSLTRGGQGNCCYRGINTVLAVPGWSGHQARGFPESKKKKKKNTCMSMVSWLRGRANTYLNIGIHSICMIFGQNVYSTLLSIFSWVIAGPYIVWIQVTRCMICKSLSLWLAFFLS